MINGSRLIACLLGWVGMVLITAGLWAQYPMPRLWTVFPAGGQAGTEVGLAVEGADLEGVETLVFSDDQLVVRPSLNDKRKPIPNEFVLTIPDGFSPGLYEVWAHSRFGASNSRLFAVGEFDEVVDKKPAHSLEQALPIGLGVTISGYVVAKEKNFYRLFVRQGQRLIVSGHAAVIDSRLEPVLELFDANGKRLQRDRHGRMIDYQAVTTGPLVVAISDLTYRGGRQFYYRLTCQAGACLDYVLPLSAEPGSEQAFHLIGRGLAGEDMGGLEAANGRRLDHRIETRTVPESFESTRSMAGRGHSRPNVFGREAFLFPAWDRSDGLSEKRIGLSGLTTLIEDDLVDPNPSRQWIKPPVSVSGLFYPVGDEDSYEFDAKKGDEFWLEVLSSRAGFGTSPLVVVERLEPDQDGYQPVATLAELTQSRYRLSERAFPLHSLDPVGRVKIKQDGRHRITVADLFNVSRAEPGRRYELRVRRARPSFRAFSISHSTLHRALNRQASVESSRMVPGQVLPMRIKVERLDGFQGALTISAESAPVGLTVHPLTIASDEDSGVLLIEAAPSRHDGHGGRDGQAVSGDLGLQVTGRVGDQVLSVPIDHGQVVWDVADYNNSPVVTRLSPHRHLSVRSEETWPVSISGRAEGGEPWQTTVAGQLDIPVHVERLGEFTDAFTFKLRGLKALAKHPGVALAKNESQATLEIDLIKTPLAPGRHEFYLYGEVKGKYRREPGAESKEVILSTYSAPVAIEVFAAPFSFEVADKSWDVTLEESVEIPVVLRRRFGFAGQIEVTSIIPDSVRGVNATSTMLRGDRFTLTLSAEAKATLGPASIELKAQGRLNEKLVDTVVKVPFVVVATR